MKFWSKTSAQRFATVALTTMSLAVFAACDEDPVIIEPNVATMRLVVGSQTINVNAVTGAVTGGPIILTANTNATVTAAFLRSDGSADPVVIPANFRLDVTPAAGTLTFTRTSAFAGTLRSTATGTTTADFALFHLGEGHEEFEHPVSVQVN